MSDAEKATKHGLTDAHDGSRPFPCKKNEHTAGCQTAGLTSSANRESTCARMSLIVRCDPASSMKLSDGVSTSVRVTGCGPPASGESRITSREAYLVWVV